MILFRTPFLVAFLIVLHLTSCKKLDSYSERMNQFKMDELHHRPLFHFTPEKNWMNDPNGMFFYKGVYHLYFQHNPDANVWGPMHWGHATSKDLKHWEEHEIALFPDELGTIFSGSAVVDHKNTSKLGTLENPPIVAIYTNHNSQKAKKGNAIDFQNQSIAYSTDEGYTWIKYERNPVLKNPGIIDFRDPKVFWHEGSQKWIMSLAAGQEIQYFESQNLLSWSYLSSFGQGIGNHDGVWECPDLFPLPVNGTQARKWVQLVSINPGGPNGGSATQYFIGDFDGTQVIVDSEFQKAMEKKHSYWIDFGKDNYAGVTFSNWSNKANGVLYLGWMSNWEYANKVPTTKWRSAMTLPRELELIQNHDGFRLHSKAPSDWDKYTVKTLEKETFSQQKETRLIEKGAIDLSTAQIKLNLVDLEEKKYTFILENSRGEKLSFGLNEKAHQFFIDRSQAGETSFSETFSRKPSIAPRTKKATSLQIQFILDKMSLEVFFDQGETVMTEIFFTHAPFETLGLKTDANTVKIENLLIRELGKK